MSSGNMDHRIGVLESRVDRVCKFISGIYWSSYLEEFKSLEQKVIELNKSLYEKISEMNDKMEKEVKSKVNNLEAEMEKEVKPKVDRLDTKTTEEVSVMVDKYRDCVRKKELAKKVFSVDIEDNIAHIKVENRYIREVSSDCLEGLSLIMKEYGSVSLEYCLSDCSNLTTLTFPSTFNTSNVRDMSGMFKRCSSLISLDLSTFNTGSVTNMNSMFSGCSNLSSLDLSTFNTSRVTNMCYMFYVCNSLYTLDLSSFDTSSVGPDDDYSGCTGMFKGCDSLGNVKYNKNDLRIKKVLPIDTTCEI